MFNVIVGQSGGPTAVINSSLAGVYKACEDNKVNILYGMKNGIEGFLNDEYINMFEYIGKDIELLKVTPASYLGSCRYKLPEIEGNESLYENIFKKLKNLDIKIFIYIGGNDSMDTINKLFNYSKLNNCNEIKFIGVPKTIDNDLPITDHTPGYGSAAKYIANSFKEIIKDDNYIKYKDGNVTIVEVMGRDAGWLTAASSLSKDDNCLGPDLIYLPEVDFDIDSFICKIKNLLNKKKGVVIAVSEGIHLSNGKYVCELQNLNKETDAFGHKQLSGTACYLAQIIKEKFGCKTRYIEFSILQRCASHILSKTDVDEAFDIGYFSVINGENGKMAYIKRTGDYKYEINFCNIDNIANKVKKIPLEWINNDNVTESFIKYAKPLINGEILPTYKDGLIQHIKNI